MMIAGCLLLTTFLFSAILLRSSYADSVEEDDGDQYFGVPLGALHFSSDGTSAEVYAADEFTIIFNHFYHNPRRAGCTAMMIGPERKEDKDNIVAGHGLLMAPAHPPVAARYRHRLRRDTTSTTVRRRRQLAEQFRGWPVEFDHLLMPSSQTETFESDALNDKTGAQPQSESNKSDVKEELLHLNKFTLSGSANENSEQKSLRAIIVTPPQSPPTIASATTIASSAINLTSAIRERNSTNYLSPTTVVTSTPIDLTTAATTNSAKAFTESSSIFIQNTSTVKMSTAENADAEIRIEEPVQDMLPIIYFDSKGSGKEKQVKLKSSSDLGMRITNSGQTISFLRNDDVSVDDDFVRRAPLRKELIDHSKNSFHAVTPQNLRTTTPLFYVIKDPREARRQRLLALKRKIGGPFTTTTTTTAPSTDEPSRDFDARFELPTIRDKLATFSLVNGAKISQYKWIGLYDQCIKRHIPLVSLRDVDPPREEKIAPLSGWSHNITSYRVHILNCNTILVPGFTYNPVNSTANTYFFVGIGEFPNNIERQMKASVVGTRRGEPLHAYNGEDVLLRLPNGYRTFDVDFITVYNTDEGKSFAHVLIPSLLVPPCAED